MLSDTLPYKSPDIDASRPAPEPGAWPIEAVVVGWIFVAFGAAFRIRTWLHWRSLWLDEIYLAHSIVTRGFHDLLLKPLDYWQGAPAGFLVLERLCIDIFGVNERALRLPSLLAALAALPLFYALVRRVLSLRGALLALAMFCSLSPLIYYAGEVKQYSTDVAVTIAILLAATELWEKPADWKAVLWYGLSGALGLFFSHPAVFVLGGTAAVLLGGRLLVARKEKSSFVMAIAPVLIVAIVWTPLELFNIAYFLRPLMSGMAHDGLVKYWIHHDGFLPIYPARNSLPWIWTSFYKILHDDSTMYLAAADLGMLAALVGAAALLRSKRPVLVLLILSPIPLALLASLRQEYPFAERLVLYMVPGLTLLIAAGVDRLWGEGSWTRNVFGLLMAAMLIGGSFSRDCDTFLYAKGREETRQIYDKIKARWRPGDVIYLSQYAAPSFDYYAPKVGLTGLEQLWQFPPGENGDYNPRLESSTQGQIDKPWIFQALSPHNARQIEAAGPGVKGYVITQPDHSTNPARYLDDIYNLFNPKPEWRWPPVKRVWVVFTHTWDNSGDDVQKLMLPELDRRAQQRLMLKEDGAMVYLYELTDTPSAYLHE